MRSHEEIHKIELAVLSLILNNEGLYVANSEIFNREIFFTEFSRNILAGYKKIMDDGRKPDLVTLSNESKVDLMTLSDIYTSIDYNYDFQTSIQALVENSISHNLLALCYYMQTELKKDTDPLTVIEKIKEVISTNELSPIKRLNSINDHIKSLIQYLADRKDQKIVGQKTGLTKWDEFTGGLQPSDLIVVAGETSSGKTSLALTMAYNAAVNHGGTIGIWSLEMSNIQLTARLVSMETKVSSKKMLLYPLNSYDFMQLSQMNLLPNSAIYIDDCTNSSIDYILSGIRMAKLRYGIKVAMVDYLQLINSNNPKDNEETKIGNNTRKLKNIAKELDITVILLSQLARDKQKPKPTLARLRGSGQIEEAADIVALIWRPEVYGITTYDNAPDSISTTGTAELLIEKGRNIGTGRMYLNFNPQITYFSDANY